MIPQPAAGRNVGRLLQLDEGVADPRVDLDPSLAFAVPNQAGADAEVGLEGESGGKPQPDVDGGSSRTQAIAFRRALSGVLRFPRVATDEGRGRVRLPKNGWSPVSWGAFAFPIPFP